MTALLSIIPGEAVPQTEDISKLSPSINYKGSYTNDTTRHDAIFNKIFNKGFVDSLLFTYVGVPAWSNYEKVLKQSSPIKQKKNESSNFA